MPASSGGGRTAGTENVRPVGISPPPLKLVGDRKSLLCRNRPDRPGAQVTKPRGCERKTHTEIKATTCNSPVCALRSQGPAATFQVGDWKILFWENWAAQEKRLTAAERWVLSTKGAGVTWSLCQEAHQAPRPVPTLSEALLGHPQAARDHQNGRKSLVHKPIQTVICAHVLGKMLRNH